jgi:hypothetical protein
MKLFVVLVGGYVYLDGLKGQEYVKGTDGSEWDDLSRLDNLLALNGCPKENQFLIEKY